MSTTQSVVFRLEGLHCIGCTEKIIKALHDEFIDSKWEFSMATGVLEGLCAPRANMRKAIQGIVNRFESGVYVLPMSEGKDQGAARGPMVHDEDPNHDNDHDSNHHNDHDHHHGGDHDHHHGSHYDYQESQRASLFGFYTQNNRLLLGSVVFVLGLLVEFFKLSGQSEAFNYFVDISFFSAYLFVGYPVLYRAFSNIRRGAFFDENFLMSIATVGAIFLGELPEALGVMLFYEWGEHFQGKAVSQSRRAIEKLLAIRPDTAHLLVEGQVFDVPSWQLVVGDEIVVRPGERMPTDASLITERAYVDASALTGESKPIHLETGDMVLGGYINLEQVLKCRVETPFSESTASRLIKLVQSAAAKKAKPEQFMTKFARVYTPIVLLLSALTAVVPPLVLGEDFSVWLYRALIFLVISCPCALVISIPLSYFGGIGAASRLGVLVKGGNYLEALAQLDTVFFDKTGTLTRGSFEVVEIATAPGVTEKVLSLWAQRAEAHSTHPIAIAIRGMTSVEVDKSPVDLQHREIPGEGIVYTGDELEVRVGKAALIKAALSPLALGVFEQTERERLERNRFSSGTSVHVSRGDTYLGCITLMDKVKDTSHEALEKLRSLGVDIAILSGDRQETVTALAHTLGVEKAFGDLKPQDKLVHVEQGLIKMGRGKIAFVGDGINDAPVIARADVGIAMGGIGSEAAIEAADVVLMQDEPLALTKAIHLARRTRGIVYQNIVMAIGVKVLFLGLGVVGISGMWEAIFADVGVALLAVLNAVRLIPKEA